MKAALNGHLDAVERLLAAGAAVDAEDKGGYTALMLAASNNHTAVIQRLLSQGAMVDHQERTQGWTALIWAAKQGHEQTVETLVRHQADPALKDFSGRTAADWARETGQTSLIPLLGPSHFP
jgi:ankyrin repeat protein